MSGWTGPGARTAPQNQQENANYAAIKAQVEKREQEKRDAENARRASEGLPPCKSSLGYGEFCGFEKKGCARLNGLQ